MARAPDRNRAGGQLAGSERAAVWRPGHPLGRASESEWGNVSATPHLRNTGPDLGIELRRWTYVRFCYLRSAAVSALIVRSCGVGRSSIGSISARVCAGGWLVCGV